MLGDPGWAGDHANHLKACVVAGCSGLYWTVPNPETLAQD